MRFWQHIAVIVVLCSLAACSSAIELASQDLEGGAYAIKVNIQPVQFEGATVETDAEPETFFEMVPARSQDSSTTTSVHFEPVAYQAVRLDFSEVRTNCDYAEHSPTYKLISLGQFEAENGLQAEAEILHTFEFPEKPIHVVNTQETE